MKRLMWFYGVIEATTSTKMIVGKELSISAALMVVRVLVALWSSFILYLHEVINLNCSARICFLFFLALCFGKDLSITMNDNGEKKTGR